METLTPHNFIVNIQRMTTAEQSKLKRADLLSLILNAPTQNRGVSEERFLELFAVVDTLKTQNVANTAEILNLKNDNDVLKEEMKVLKKEKESLNIKMSEHDDHFNEIEQYLRVDNLEIVGHPDIEEGADFEK